MERFSHASLHMMGMLALEKQDIEKEITNKVSKAEKIRLQDGSDCYEIKAIHAEVKRLTSEYVRVINEMETLKRNFED